MSPKNDNTISDDDDYDRYFKILVQLFNIKNVDLAHYAFALLRLGQVERTGADPLFEARDMLEDLMGLNRLTLPKTMFKDPDKTHLRLHLLSYIHLTEMNAPYHVLANILRVRLGMSYTLYPFPEFEKKLVKVPEYKKGKNFKPPTLKASSFNKITEIKRLAQKADIPEVGNIFDEFYFSTLRNSITHSDYALEDDELHLMHKKILDPQNPGRLTDRIKIIDLKKIIARAYNFYTAFFALETLARSYFANLKGSCQPYDQQLKGMIEFLIDEDELMGVKVHWPNKVESSFKRGAEGCDSENLIIRKDGRVEFAAGKMYSDHAPFSPLIPKGGKPHYTSAEGKTLPPHWPNK
ncbi:hypothetical protein K1X76_06715 [bacterium]|nr:hypothetical protein [bacterium]